MAIIKSNIEKISSSGKKVREFLENISNYEQLMPDRVEDWRCDGSQCHFSIKGTADLGFKIIGTNDEKITLSQDDETKLSFTINVFVNQFQENSCECNMILEASINPVMEMMITNPLKNFLNMMLEKLSKVNFD